MAQIKDRQKFNIDLPYPHRLDAAVDNWMKRHLPLVHRFNQIAVNWLSRPHPHSTPRSILLSGLATLIILIIVYWLGR